MLGLSHPVAKIVVTRAARANMRPNTPLMTPIHRPQDWFGRPC